MGEEKRMRSFSKNAKGVMRIMLGMSAMLASIGGVIASMGYFSWVRRAYMP